MTDTAWIPVIEGEVATTPMVRVDTECCWCRIRLCAIPVRPVTRAGFWFHPGCLPAFLADLEENPCWTV